MIMQDLTEIRDYEWQPLTSALIKKMQVASVNAPWSGFTWEHWNFALHGTVPWTVHRLLLEAYLSPRNKADVRRQAQALEQLNSGQHPASSLFSLGGIGRVYIDRVGGWSGTGYEGEQTSVYEKHYSPPPSAENRLAQIMDNYWPDIPPLVWSRVAPSLMQRSESSTQEFNGRSNDYVVDVLDFGRLYRFLSHVDRLDVVPSTDWEAVINPPAVSESMFPGRKRNFP